MSLRTNAYTECVCVKEHSQTKGEFKKTQDETL